jgi:UPF0755 protein
VRFISRLVVFLVSLAVPLLVVGAAYFACVHYALKPRDPNRVEMVIFDTETWGSFRQIASQLESQGLIRSSFAFRMLARWYNKDTQIKAGEYALKASMTPLEILDIMVRGETIPRKATIREGMTLVEIGLVLEEAGIVDRPSFEQALADKDLLREEGIDVQSFEGYLFPETYNFRRNTQARQVIKAMHEQLKRRWPAEWNVRAQELGMSKHQILTLASIVEKESGNFDEQPIIASVFHNRLKMEMRLQADPTVIYGIKNFNGNITKRDLQTETPYNTYVISGLPPGPIANPGLSAIKAALYPAETRYLYFVGNGEGRHIFSENLDQHNNAVNRFQRGGSLRKGPAQDERGDSAQLTATAEQG